MGIRRKTRDTRNRGGFSLVEVMSSLGIVSFGMVALLGLLPIGLKVSRDSRESTAEAQITQYLSNLTRQMSAQRFKAMADSSNPQIFYFDQQGACVQEPLSPDVFYTAIFSTSVSPGTTLPSASDSSYLSASLSTVSVRLTKINNSSPPRTLALHRVFPGP